MLTLNSEAPSRRTKIYQAIARERDNFGAGIPKGLNVLVKEPKSLGLNVDRYNGAA